MTRFLASDEHPDGCKLEELLLEAVGNTDKLDKLKGEIKGA